MTFLLSSNACGIIKSSLDRALPDIRFVVLIETDIGLSFVSSNISFIQDKSNVRLGSVLEVRTVPLAFKLSVD